MVRRARRTGLRLAPVRDHAEVAEEELRGTARTAKARRQDPDSPGSDVELVTAPVRFSDPPAPAAVRVPELGQHTEEVLVEAGFGWDATASLSAEGAI